MRVKRKRNYALQPIRARGGEKNKTIEKWFKIDAKRKAVKVMCRRNMPICLPRLFSFKIILLKAIIREYVERFLISVREAFHGADFHSTNDMA